VDTYLGTYLSTSLLPVYVRNTRAVDS